MKHREDIEGRLARFARSRHARDLWPDVSVAMFRAAQREIARVTAAVLAGTPASLGASSRYTAEALNVAAFAGGMGPLLGYWSETGRCAVHPVAAERFATALDHGRRRATRMGGALGDIATSLASQGVYTCIIKSTDTRYRYFPDPGTRTSADIDLLVPTGDWEVTGRVLQQAGFRAHGATWSPPGPAQVPRSLAFAHVDDPWTLHVHRALDQPGSPAASATLGTPDPSACERWHGLGSPMLVLPPPFLLAHLALHTSARLGAIMLVRLVELVLVMRRDFAPGPDVWRAFAELVDRTRTAASMFPALTLAERLAPGTVDAGVLGHIAAVTPARLRRVVGHTTPATALHIHPLPHAG